MAPTFAHGKICYIEMPATDIRDRRNSTNSSSSAATRHVRHSRYPPPRRGIGDLVGGRVQVQAGPRQPSAGTWAI
jgi:hypothetical protein